MYICPFSLSLSAFCRWSGEKEGMRVLSLCRWCVDASQTDVSKGNEQVRKHMSENGFIVVAYIID